MFARVVTSHLRARGANGQISKPELNLSYLLRLGKLESSLHTNSAQPFGEKLVFLVSQQTEGSGPLNTGKNSTFDGGGDRGKHGGRGSEGVIAPRWARTNLSSRWFHCVAPKPRCGCGCGRAPLPCLSPRAGAQMEVLPRAVLRPSEVRMPRVPCRRSSVELSRSKILAVVSAVSAMASLKSSITLFICS